MILPYARRGVWAALVLSACADPLFEPADSDGGTGSPAAPAPVLPGWQSPNGACDLDPPAAGLLLTTTDFATGAVTVVDVETMEVRADVALATPDAIPFWHEGRAFLVHRFQYDFLDVLRPGPVWVSQGQHNLVDATTVAPNPQSIAFDRAGLAYVPLFASPSVQVLDLSKPPGQSFVGTINIEAVADDDGSPEASLSVMCGDTLFVSLQRLDSDAGFVPTGPDMLAAIDTVSGSVYDLDPSTSAVDTATLGGQWVKQLRRDPLDTDGLTLLALTTGIESIDTRTGAVAWLVKPSVFEAASIDHFQLPIAFDVVGDSHTFIVASYGPNVGEQVDCAVDPGPCFGQARLFYVDADAAAPELIEFAGGFDAVERTLEVVGTNVWFGSRRLSEPGLWVFDASVMPPQVLAGPLSTGLPPYSMTTTAVVP